MKGSGDPRVEFPDGFWPHPGVHSCQPAFVSGPGTTLGPRTKKKKAAFCVVEQRPNGAHVGGSIIDGAERHGRGPMYVSVISAKRTD